MLGVVAYAENQEEVFLGHSVARTRTISEETAKLIDSEVRKHRRGGATLRRAGS
jgi:cell division protease FtsH